MKPPSSSKPRSPTTDAIQLQGRRTRRQALLPRTTSDSGVQLPPDSATRRGRSTSEGQGAQLPRLSRGGDRVGTVAPAGGGRASARVSLHYVLDPWALAAVRAGGADQASRRLRPRATWWDRGGRSSCFSSGSSSI